MTESNQLTLKVREGDTTREVSFRIAPTIGHCIDLQTRGIDLLGSDSDAEIHRLVANPLCFCEVLEVLIGSEEEQFRMPALAGLFNGPTWTEAREVVFSSFRDFFQSSGHTQIAAALDRLIEAADTVTKQVAESLESGELREAIDREVKRTVGELTTVSGD
ncbi:MAG: hypothetical protein NXI04_17485 [Planctomycetaceae bacterium]|nr:hypothetical protein [Planctomycetaceae bacterium]